MHTIVYLTLAVGLGVGIAVGIVTSFFVFGIANITLRIIAKCKVKFKGKNVLSIFPYIVY